MLFGPDYTLLLFIHPTIQPSIQQVIKMNMQMKKWILWIYLNSFSFNKKILYCHQYGDKNREDDDDDDVERLLDFYLLNELEYKSY